MSGPVIVPMSLTRPFLVGCCGLLLAALNPATAAAQESFILERGSNVGPETKIKPVDCVTGRDGSITCDTKIQNSPSDTPARPVYQPFNN